MFYSCVFWRYRIVDLLYKAGMELFLLYAPVAGSLLALFLPPITLEFYVPSAPGNESPAVSGTQRRNTVIAAGLLLAPLCRNLWTW